MYTIVFLFCSIIFHFALLFYLYVLLILFNVYYSFFQPYFFYIMNCFILFLLYMSILIYYFLDHSIFAFPLKIHYFLQLGNIIINATYVKIYKFHIFYIPMYFFCSIFLFLYYHIIFHIASLSLAFYTFTSYSVMFFCPNCQHTFSSSRGFSIHCYTCNNDINYTHLPSSSTTSQDNLTKIIQLTKHQSMIFYKICCQQKKQKNIQYKWFYKN